MGSTNIHTFSPYRGNDNIISSGASVGALSTVSEGRKFVSHRKSASTFSLPVYLGVPGHSKPSIIAHRRPRSRQFVVINNLPYPLEIKFPDKISAKAKRREQEQTGHMQVRKIGNRELEPDRCTISKIGHCKRHSTSSIGDQTRVLSIVDEFKEKDGVVEKQRDTGNPRKKERPKSQPPDPPYGVHNLRSYDETSRHPNSHFLSYMSDEHNSYQCYGDGEVRQRYQETPQQWLSQGTVPPSQYQNPQFYGTQRYKQNLGHENRTQGANADTEYYDASNYYTNGYSQRSIPYEGSGSGWTSTETSPAISGYGFECVQPKLSQNPQYFTQGASISSLNMDSTIKNIEPEQEDDYLNHIYDYYLQTCA